ncbi:hypothetical protein GGH94_005217 [Coemansia aciculifera]|uniref:SUZ domain-containing protein n=1 Tax=Coemansia aciculifera TaxID=417176 RepID=A0A9W8IEA3_9FUNG|nr:hypothetical protein GGH94_005217 [Coemansia aciculifera]KAJ2871010.1 hypothetical protein GGH93_005146 [Coemansia aciculifera]
MSADDPFDDWESALDAAVAAEADRQLALPHTSLPSSMLSPFINAASPVPHASATPASLPQQPVTPPKQQQQQRLRNNNDLANRAIWEQANSYEPYESESVFDQTTYMTPIKVLQRAEPHKTGSICRSQKQAADQLEPCTNIKPMSLTEKQRAYEEARRKIFEE